MSVTSYHWVLTVQRPMPSGFTVGTWNGTYNAGPSTTRETAFNELVAKYADGASVLFFSFERNVLEMQ